ncbi:MAG: L-threonylcarbamoyladenylate synthase [Kiritimatiellia bacterium]|jgi:L-threonylcarbamoyladenylate synthase|nr:L-threonylcarbamoyladenylate synthase [Kiritimatiellia bacterium]MDP6847668.1 L-threonylcarbamoyladenylate synthase [Kiritimatiellia bacterium]
MPRVIDIAFDVGCDAIEEAAAVLGEGGLVVMPTDTVYGVAADPSLDIAVARIYGAKRRDPEKPLPLLAGDLRDVLEFGATLGKCEMELAGRFWPGPLTLVVRAGDVEEGFRVPDHEVALALLRKAGGILRVTSANMSGQPEALTAEAAVEALGDSVDLVLDAGPVPGGTPSSVIRIVDGKVEMLRAGALNSEVIASVVDACRDNLE